MTGIPLKLRKACKYLSLRYIGMNGVRYRTPETGNERSGSDPGVGDDRLDSEFIAQRAMKLFGP